MRSYLRYTKNIFEGVKEDGQADKKRENDRAYCKYKLYQSGSRHFLRAIVYGSKRRCRTFYLYV